MPDVEFLPVKLSERERDFQEFLTFIKTWVMLTSRIPPGQLTSDGYGHSELEGLLPLLRAEKFAQEFNRQFFEDRTPQWVKNYQATEQRRLTA